MASENKESYTFFWKVPSPFSQWCPSEFTVDGVEYNCAEQFMMHQKAVLFGDNETAESILKTDSPRKMKSMGRQVRNFDQQLWDDSCKALVKQGNLAKFSQNKDMKKALYDTDGTVLVEASPLDKIWGIGLAADNPKAHRKRTWKGKNLLGYILTDVRYELMKQEAMEESGKAAEKGKVDKHSKTGVLKTHNQRMTKDSLVGTSNVEDLAQDERSVEEKEEDGSVENTRKNLDQEENMEDEIHGNLVTMVTDGEEKDEDVKDCIEEQDGVTDKDTELVGDKAEEKDNKDEIGDEQKCNVAKDTTEDGDESTMVEETVDKKNDDAMETRDETTKTEIKEEECGSQ